MNSLKRKLATIYNNPKHPYTKSEGTPWKCAWLNHWHPVMSKAERAEMLTIWKLIGSFIVSRWKEWNSMSHSFNTAET